MIVRHPWLRFPRLTALWMGLVLGMLAAAGPARAQSGRSRPPGSRAPANSSALRGASQAPRSTAGSLPSSLFAAGGPSVQLPYNMVWGDTQQRLAALFGGVGAKVTDKKASGQTEIWTVQGLIAPDLQASMFTFQGGLLVAMEFDYGQKDWDLPKYNDKMGLFRRVLETKCGGPGEMVSRDTTQEPNSTVKETFMGYQWNRGDTMVQLFYFSAEDSAKAMNFRTISIHYHYKDPIQDQPMPEVGGGPPADPNSNPLFGGAGGSTAATPATATSSTPMTSPAPVRGGSPGPSPAVVTGEATSGSEASPGPSPVPVAPDGNLAPSPAASATPATVGASSPSPSPAATPKGKKLPASPENDPLPER